MPRLLTLRLLLIFLLIFKLIFGANAAHSSPASAAWTAYDVAQTYKNEGGEAALKQLAVDGAISVVALGAGKVAYKVGGKLIDSAPEAFAAVKNLGIWGESGAATTTTIVKEAGVAERVVVKTNSIGDSVVQIQGKEMSIHASQQATTRGISNQSIANAMDQKPFNYVQNGQTLQGYYDAASNTFVGVGDRITTVIRPSNPQNYINNLRNRQ